MDRDMPPSSHDVPSLSLASPARGAEDAFNPRGRSRTPRRREEVWEIEEEGGGGGGLEEEEDAAVEKARELAGAFI
eukprot:2742569-Rhodomonas_salina.2